MPHLDFERRLPGPVAGIDEAGRGPLAGPVVAAAVVVRADAMPEALAAAIDDSKALSRAKREALFDDILRHCIVGIGEASVAEIDALNILQATFLAMRRAVDALPVAPAAALVDGNRAPKLACEVRTLVGGDAQSLSIAAASIVAKVSRDRIMGALAADHPGYGWERNSGYPTPDHRDALRRLGPSPHHRRSFAPVARLLLAETVPA